MEYGVYSMIYGVWSMKYLVFFWSMEYIVLFWSMESMEYEVYFTPCTVLAQFSRTIYSILIKEYTRCEVYILFFLLKGV